MCGLSASGKNANQSAVLAGYSAKSAEVIASENLRKPEVLKKVEAILNSAGLSDEQLVDRFKKMNYFERPSKINFLIRAW